MFGLGLPKMEPLTISMWPVLVPALRMAARRKGVSVEAFVAELVCQAFRLRLHQSQGQRRMMAALPPETRSANARAAARARWARVAPVPGVSRDQHPG